jgi:hypothetical protein
MATIALRGRKPTLLGIHSVVLRPFAIWDPTQRKLRLGRIVWQRGEWGEKRADGTCKPYSFAVSLALRPKLFSFRREYDQVRVTILGVSVNYHRSAGGTIV